MDGSCACHMASVRFYWWQEQMQPMKWFMLDHAATDGLALVPDSSLMRLPAPCTRLE